MRPRDQHLIETLGPSCWGSVSQGVVKGRVACWEGATRCTIWREPAPPRVPEPTTTALAKSFECPVSIEHFDATARYRIDIEERHVLSVATIKARHFHAVGSVVSAMAKPRRKSAAACALLHAVKKARVSVFRRLIQFSI
jgi:hypothetical protein